MHGHMTSYSWKFLRQGSLALLLCIKSEYFDKGQTRNHLKGPELNIAHSLNYPPSFPMYLN